MTDVNKVFITKEVADSLDLSTAYLLRLAKKLLEEGELTSKDFREAGKRNYIFNENAVEIIGKNLTRKG